MEWFLTSPSSPKASEICFYDHLDRMTKGELQWVVELQMNNPAYQRYVNVQSERWRWSAESRLCMAYSIKERRIC